MRRRMVWSLAIILVAVAGLVLAQQPAPPVTHLKVGDPAPDFTLRDQNNKPVKLSDFKGKKNVVLAFYVLAFTGGWTKELKAYQADIAKFEKTESQVLGISVDSPFANKKFADEIGVTFPLLSDLSKKVSKEYGILIEEPGVARRSTFVVDKAGIIQHIEQDKTAIDPSGAHAVCSRFVSKS